MARRLDVLFAGPWSFSRLLILSYVLVTVLLTVMSAGGERSLGQLIMEGPSRGLLWSFGAVSPTRLAEGEWWRLINHTFLHGGFAHLFMNCLMLGIFGPVAEMVYGRARFLLIYLGCGVGGGLASSLAHWGELGFISVGASGAIFGLLGLLAVYGKRRGDVVGNGLFHRILFFLFLNLLIAVSGLMEDIDHWGHGGGLAAGVLLGLLVRAIDTRSKGEEGGVRLFATAAMLIVATAWGLGAHTLVGVGERSGPTSRNMEITWNEYSRILLDEMRAVDISPSRLARRARILDEFADLFEVYAEEQQKAGEDMDWLHQFVAEQRLLHELLRRDGPRPLRWRQAAELYSVMVEAPSPWSVQWTLYPAVAGERSGERVLLWRTYWRNLGPLAFAPAEAIDGAVMDRFNQLFAAEEAALREAGQDVAPFQAIQRVQQDLHAMVRAGASAEERLAVAARIARMMDAAPRSWRVD